MVSPNERGLDKTFAPDIAAPPSISSRKNQRVFILAAIRRFKLIAKFASARIPGRRTSARRRTGYSSKKTVEQLAHLCRRPGITFTQRLDDSALGRVSARDKALEIVNCSGLCA